jgi:transmembrane sensor
MTTGDTLPFPSDEAQSVERIAAQWTLRQQLGLTPVEQKQLEVWLESDPRHTEIFAEMNETSELLDQLRESAPANEPAALMGSQPAKARQLGWVVATLAAAAAVMIGWFVWSRPAPDAGPFATSAATEVGAVRELSLPDGSVVKLNTDSAVVVRYTGEERRVRLTKGEAYFSVAKNSNRPFWVEAGTVAVRAVGTAFSVRRRDNTVDVLVTEGKVRIEDTGSKAGATAAVPPVERFLVAGQRLSIAAATVVSRAPVAPTLPTAVPREEITRALAWQQQRLQFDGTPLSEVVAEFNRHNRHQLVIADPGLADQRFGGAFSAQGYDAFLEIIEQSFGVKAERRENVTILRRAGK